MMPQGFNHRQGFAAVVEIKNISLDLLAYYSQKIHYNGIQLLLL